MPREKRSYLVCAGLLWVLSMVSLPAILAVRQRSILFDLLVLSGKIAKLMLPTDPTLNRQAFVFCLCSCVGRVREGRERPPAACGAKLALSVPLGTLRFFFDFCTTGMLTTNGCL